ncbi:MAG: hypothetical protein HONDAALG_03903 [Gammaproteobacteria bacterium]|nr:hypothetical protein [Gammaproteobacteria bacterium]
MVSLCLHVRGWMVLSFAGVGFGNRYQTHIVLKFQFPCAHSIGNLSRSRGWGNVGQALICSLPWLKGAYKILPGEND